MTTVVAAQKPRKVFVSYASANRERVGILAQALEKEGFDVWWDHALNPGEDYREKIRDALASCDAAVVAWSGASSQSTWVISEAERVRHWNRLIPVIIEPCTIPQPFDVLHTSDLTKWTGSRSAPVFQKLAEAVRAKAEGREPKRTAWRRRLVTWGSVGALATALATMGTPLYVAVERVVSPPASATQVDKVMDYLRSIDPDNVDPVSQELMLPSMKSLAESQEGAQVRATAKMVVQDRDGAMAELQAAANAGEAGTKGLAETYRQIGAIAYPDRTKDSIVAYERARALDPENPDTWHLLGNLYRRDRRFDDAIAAHRFVLDGAGAANVEWKARSLGNLGLVARAQEKFDEGIAYHQQALALFVELKQPESQANQLGNLGLIYRAERRFAEAIELHAQAVKLNREIGRKDGLARQLSNMALAERGLYRAPDMQERNDLRIGELQSSARTHLQESLALYRQLEDREAEARQTGNYGLVLMDMGLLEDAERQFSQSLAIHHGRHNREGEAAQLDNLGLVRLARGDLEGAENFFLRAMGANLDIDRKQGVALQFRNLGDVALAAKQPALAESHWRKSLRLYRELKRGQSVKELSQLLASIGVSLEDSNN